MRYFEFTNISEASDCELGLMTPLADGGDAVAGIARLKQLNRERLELLAMLVHRELRRYLSCDEYERLQLEQRLGY